MRERAYVEGVYKGGSYVCFAGAQCGDLKRLVYSIRHARQRQSGRCSGQHSRRRFARTGPSEGAQTAAADDDNARADLLAQAHDLLDQAAEAEVGLGYLSASHPDPLHLRLEQALGVVPNLDRLPLGQGVERRQVLYSVRDV